MKYIVLFGILAMLVLVGCVSTPVTPPSEKPPVTTEPVCRTVTEQKTVIHEECGPVSYTEQVCGKRKLSYLATKLPVLHLCVSDGGCVGKEVTQCPACSQIMSRCTMVILNEDKTAAGTWTVAANFTLSFGGFNREPVTYVIQPNESASFDFQQFYAPGSPVRTADCSIGVVSEPVIEDCHEETRTRTECKNVTATEPVEKQVCE